MSERLNNKIVVVSGGASGIGKQLWSFPKKVLKVVISDWTDKEKELSDSLNGKDYKTTFIKIDVPNDEDVQKVNL